MPEAELFHQGSVKKFYLIRPPTADSFGRGYLLFDSDGLSVFDYGELPWKIKGKGQRLYGTTKRFFGVLDESGIPHHMLRDMGDGKVGVHVGKIPEGYDDIERGVTTCYLVPLEVVFSTTVTPVASLHKDLRSGKVKPADFGLEGVPDRYETVTLPTPRVRFSTKIEAVDVYRRGLAEQAGLVGNEEDRLKDLALAVNDAIRKDGAEVGLDVADGKIECVMGRGRNFMVGDTCYTWDECRMLVTLDDGRVVDLSKQLPRNIYTINGWKAELKAAQKAHPEDRSQWPPPPPLSDDLMELCSDACHAVSGAIERNPDAPALKPVAERVAEALDKLRTDYKRDETGADL